MATQQITRRPAFLGELRETAPLPPGFLRDTDGLGTIRPAFLPEGVVPDLTSSTDVLAGVTVEEELLEAAPPVAEPPRTGSPRTAVPVAPPAPPPEAMYSRLAAAIDQLEVRSTEAIDNLAHDAVELGLVVARRIVQAELNINPEAIFGAVREAVASLGESNRFEIRLHPEDIEAVRAARGESSPLPHGSGVSVRLEADPSLIRGDCIIESEHGHVDASLEARIQRVREALLATPLEEISS